MSKLKISASDWSDRLTYINVKLEEICEAITEAHQNYFGVFATKNLVASSDETKREYTLPDDILNNLVLVQLKLDGTNWIDAKRTEITPQTGFRFQESWITNNYNNTTPKYAVFRNSLIILSGTITAVTSGMRLFYLNYPDPIADLTENTTDLKEATDPASTIKVGFPKQFHELLARAVIIEWKGVHELPLTGREPIYEQDLERKIKRLRMQDLDQVIRGKIPYEEGRDDF